MIDDIFLIFLIAPIILIVILIIYSKQDSRIRAKRGLEPRTHEYVVKEVRIMLTFVGTLIIPAIIFRAQGDDAYTKPFSEEHLPTIITLYYVGSISYWISRFGNHRLSPILRVLAQSCLLQGVVLLVFIFTHLFLADNPLGSAILFLTPAGWTLIVCLYLFIRELWQSHNRLLHVLKKRPLSAMSRFQRFNVQVLLLPFWKRFPVLAVVMLPLFILQETILILFGQAPDAPIRAFVESCGLYFSDPAFCPPPLEGGHYLCTVATHGNPRLVRPVRYGVRRGGKILVSRQLLIANAFEQWLEEHAPRLARRLRRFYDRLDIPVERWARNRRKANFIYIVM